MPPPSTTSLTSIVVTISRRSGWFAIACGEPLAQRAPGSTPGSRAGEGGRVGQVGGEHLGR